VTARHVGARGWSDRQILPAVLRGREVIRHRPSLVLVARGWELPVVAERVLGMLPRERKGKGMRPRIQVMGLLPLRIVRGLLPRVKELGLLPSGLISPVVERVHSVMMVGLYEKYLEAVSGYEVGLSRMSRREDHKGQMGKGRELYICKWMTLEIHSRSV